MQSLATTLQSDFTSLSNVFQEILNNWHAAETGVYQGNNQSSGSDSGSGGTDVADSSSSDSDSSDSSPSFMQQLQSLMQYLGMGKSPNDANGSAAQGGESSASTAGASDTTPATTANTGSDTTVAANPTNSSAESTTSSMAPTQASNVMTAGAGTAGSDAAATTSTQSTATGDYSPANDAPLQNLSNTYDGKLQNTLMNAYKDVQNGSLSQAGYQQFENTSIALTDPNSDASKGIGFTSDTPLEQYALKGIQGNMSSGDASTLNQIVGTDASVNQGGVMYGTNADSTIGNTTTGGTGDTGSGGTTTTGGGGNSSSGGTGGETNVGGGLSNGTAQISLQDMENQQNVNDDTVLPGGPVSGMGYGWYKGAQPNWPNPNMPANADSVVPWVDEYPINGTALTPGTSIDVSNLNVDVLMKDGSWKQESTSNNNSGDWLEQNPNNMQGITANPTMQFNADGSMNIAAAPDGNINQFGSGGGTFNASDIQGIYVSGTVQGNSDNTNAAVQVGADFYTNGQYNQGAGTANWLAVTDKPQTFTYTNIPDSVLNGDPPPGVTA